MNNKIKKYDSMNRTYEDQELTKNEKLIYNYLILMYNEGLGYAYPSYVSLKKALSSTRNDTVSKTLKSLEEKSYIKRTMENGKNTKYFLLKHIENTTKNEGSTKSEHSTKNEGSTKSEHSTKSEGSTKNEHTTSTKSEHGVVRKVNYNSINIELDNSINKKRTDLDILIDEYTDNENLKSTLKDFLKMRKSIKSPMTDKALKMLFNKLNKLTDKEQVKVDILEQSIFNNWKGVFELKENQEQYNEKKPKNNVTKLKTRFHNISQTYQKYTPEELEELLQENQKNKFNNSKTIEMIPKEVNPLKVDEVNNNVLNEEPKFTPHFMDHFENINC